jgi:hypothetical protein
VVSFAVAHASTSAINRLGIRAARAERLAAALGNPGATLEDYAELNKNLAQLERYERRAFSRPNRALLAMSQQ